MLQYLMMTLFLLTSISTAIFFSKHMYTDISINFIPVTMPLLLCHKNYHVPMYTKPSTFPSQDVGFSTMLFLVAYFALATTLVFALPQGEW